MSTERLLPSGEARPTYNLERLLDVAVQVFTERGYDGASFQHLSHASGLSKSSIYHHIESKEQLLRLGLEKALEPLMASTTETGATTGPAIDRLTYLHVEYVGPQRLFVVAAVDLTGDDPEPHLAVRLRQVEAEVEQDPLIEDAILTLALPDAPALTP